MLAGASPLELLREFDQLLCESLDRFRRFRLARRAPPEDRAVYVPVADVGADRCHQTGLFDEDVRRRDELGQA